MSHAYEYEIDKSLWHTCQITGVSIKDLAKKYGGSGVYYTDVFKKYLQEVHNISLEEYFEKYCKLERPICQCGVCNQNVDIAMTIKSKFSWSKCKCGRFDGWKERSERYKIERLGSGNPMYQKKPWNLGLTTDSHESIKSSSEKNKLKKASAETRKKQSEAAKKRLIPGNLGKRHSEESKEKMRQNTLRMIKDGRFKQTKTKPCIAFARLLQKNNIKFEEEKLIKHWSVDFYLIDFDIYIEIDGDYFHSNPKIYPCGPKTKTQKINYSRDLSKNKYFNENNLRLLRIWESDILNNEDIIICKLNQLLELNSWDNCQHMILK